MFSFRTTPLEDQLDRALTDGNVGCFCTQNCWDTGRERYMTDIFRERGNLRAVFSPDNSELSPDVRHIEVRTEQIRELTELPKQHRKVRRQKLKARKMQKLRKQQGLCLQSQKRILK